MPKDNDKCYKESGTSKCGKIRWPQLWFSFPFFFEKVILMANAALHKVKESKKFEASPSKLFGSKSMLSKIIIIKE